MIRPINEIIAIQERLESLVSQLDGDAVKTLSEALSGLDKVKDTMAGEMASYEGAIQTLNNQGLYERGSEFIEVRV